MISYLIDSEWKWCECSLPIKRYQPNKGHNEEEYVYQIMNCEDENYFEEENLKIEVDKSFPFEPETGFIWHKSWNLPEITVSIDTDEFNIISAKYDSIHAEIMSVYPVKFGDLYFLNEVPLEGPCVKEFTESTISLKFLKFSETSFNHNRNKFSLLIWVYGKNKFEDKEDLYCHLSSPVYVDSRKEARKKEVAVKDVQPNIPNIKKFSTSLGGTKGSVANSSEGFLGYYGAQNIRNKIKHPFYICYHFDKLFWIYHNTSVQDYDVLRSLEAMKENSTPVSLEKDESLFLLVIVQTNEKVRKKIISMVDKWKFKYIQYSHPENQISNKYRRIQREELKVNYKLYYDNETVRVQENLFWKADEGRRERGKGIDKEEGEKNLSVYEHRTVLVLGGPRKQVKTQI